MKSPITPIRPENPCTISITMPADVPVIEISKAINALSKAVGGRVQCLFDPATLSLSFSITTEKGVSR